VHDSLYYPLQHPVYPLAWLLIILKQPSIINLSMVFPKSQAWLKSLLFLFSRNQGTPCAYLDYCIWHILLNSSVWGILELWASSGSNCIHLFRKHLAQWSRNVCWPQFILMGSISPQFHGIFWQWSPSLVQACQWAQGEPERTHPQMTPEKFQIRPSSHQCHLIVWHSISFTHGLSPLLNNLSCPTKRAGTSHPPEWRPTRRADIR